MCKRTALYMSENFQDQCYSTADRMMPTTVATLLPPLRLKHHTNKYDNLNAILHVKRQQTLSFRKESGKET